jgi:hypothetical protein
MTPIPRPSPRARRLRALVTALALLGAAACASSTAAGSRSSAIQPPQLVSTPRSPQLNVSPGAPGRDPVDVRIEVAVDEAGHADLSTLRVSGRGAASNQSAITRWLQTARFTPAQQDGRPVRGIYRTSFAARVVTRRM